MPRYTFRISDGDLMYEASDVSLPDPELARDLAVRLAADLFSSSSAPFHESWNRCSIRVVAADGEAVFAASAGEAALIERDLVRTSSAELADN